MKRSITKDKQTNTAALPRRIGIAALVLIIILVIFVVFGCRNNNPVINDPANSDLPFSQNEVTAYIFSVGEALSVFIDDGDVEILIDGGNDGGKKKDNSTVADSIAGYIEDGTLEYVIATHSHADHVGGLDADIYDAYHVAHTIYGDKSETNEFIEFMNAATAEEDSEVHEDINEVIILSEGVTLSIFDIIDGNNNTNNNSIISLLDCYGKTMLITGDAEDQKSSVVKTALTERLAAEKVFGIDVYVVGHHGSETSSSAELLEIIRPKYAIISSAGPGYRNYNNPNPDVLKRLLDVNAEIYATYISGDISVAFTKDAVRISPSDMAPVTLENYLPAA